MDGNGELDLLKQIKESVEKNGADVAKQWGEELRANRAKVREATDQAEVDTEVITKKCTKCGEEKALDAFSAQKSGKHGKTSRCKICVRNYYQERKSVIPKQSNATSKKCTKCGEVKALSDYYVSSIAKDGRRSDCKKCCKKYNTENRERIDEYNRNYRRKNKKMIADYYKKYQKTHKERIATYNSGYFRSNPEVSRRSSRKRRALKRSLPHAPLTPAQYERLYEFRDQVFGEVTS